MAKVYVIDDDEQLLRMVGLMLQRGGHTVTLINNPVDGMAEIEADAPDLLILDVMMPNISGHDLAQQIRSNKELENLPILMLTARAQEIDKEAALESGADGYLSKPVTAQELIEQVDILLSAQREEVETDQGILITLFGLRGGVGQTTLAVNLASALRRLSQREVCLVDLSTSGGQSLLHLRLQTRNSWADLPADDEFDWPTLQEQLMIHPSGLRILAAPNIPQSPLSLSAPMTEHILETLRENHIFTIVDAPRVFSPAFETALSMSDMALHVLSPEVVAVQTAVQTNRAILKADIHLKYKAHISNQISIDAQLTPESIERALNTRIAFQVNHDPNQLRAITQGVPLSLTSAKSPLPTVIGRMADVIWQRVTKTES